MKELLNKIAAWLKKLWQKVKNWIYTDLDPDIDPDTMCQVTKLKSEVPEVSLEAANTGFYPILLTITNKSDEEVDITCETRLVPASDSIKCEMSFHLGIGESYTRQFFVNANANLLDFKKAVVIDNETYYAHKGCVPKQGMELTVTVKEDGLISIKKKCVNS